MNAYPNADNYLQPSLGTPEIPPSVDPDEGILISVAYNPAWTKVLLGAVTQLSQYAAWDADHDTKIETIERVNSLLFLLQNDVTTVPAPFWDEDSADDSDDTAPVDDQPWYGQIVIIDDRLTFVENAFIYLVSGFIAYSGQVGAAVSFIPIARNFVVTMKSNPLGGIVRFLADAVEIGRADTYAAADGALDVPMTMPAPTMGFVAEDVTTYPTLWIELLEDNPHDLPSVSMTLVRSRLSQADFSNPNIRYNPDTDQIEQTPDGGTTWNPAPGLDPRHSSTFLKPPVAGSSKQCDAAANMVKWLHDFIDQMLFDFELVGGVTTIINSILIELEILAPYAELLAIISELAETISGIGGTALAAAFTSDQYDLLECIFFCNADGSGRISVDALAEVEAEITAQLNTTAALITNAILSVQGEIGLSNAGSVGSETGDCDGCECGWCYEFDFSAGDGGWVAFPSAGYEPGDTRGNYADARWNSSKNTTTQHSSELFFRIALPMAGHVTSVQVLYNRTPGSFDLGFANSISADGDYYIGVTAMSSDTSEAAGNTSISYSGDIDVASYINVWLFASITASGDPGGSLYCTSIKLRGTGDNPFGADNC
jgi:hypothetical protein